MNSGHAASDVAVAITDELRDTFGINVSETFISAISDTAASALAVADHLETSADIDFEGQRCAMHTGDLVLSYACGLKCRTRHGVDLNPFPAGKTLIGKLQCIASHFSRSTRDFELLGQVARQNSIPFVTLKPRQDTRMASTYNLIQSCLRMKFALEVFFSLNHGDAELRKHVLSADEWKFAAEMEGALCAISDVIKLAQKENDVTSSYTWVFALKAKQVAAANVLQVIDLSRQPDPSWKSARDLPRVSVPRANLTRCGQTLLARVYEELDERFHEPSNHEMIAMLLDPRSRDLKFLSNETWKADGRKYLKDAYMVLWGKMKAAGVVGASGCNLDSTDSQQAEDDVFTVSVTDFNEEGDAKADIEISEWLSLKINWANWISPGSSLPKDRVSLLDLYVHVNCCSFWRAHEAKFPTLSVLARIFLGLPSAQSFQERLFSTASSVMGERRCNLNPSVFKQLTLLKHNREFVKRVRDANNHRAQVGGASTPQE